MNSRARLPQLALFFGLALFVSAQPTPVRTIHVFVALADNEHQGIIPVPARLGNGLNAEHNLYWGAAAGVKTFFARSPGWSLIQCSQKPKVQVLERCVFKRRDADIYLVADAYRGDEIRQAILDFFDSAAGVTQPPISLPPTAHRRDLAAYGAANLVAYVGHDGLMDFRLPLPRKKNDDHRDAIILACASKQYYADALRASGAYPLLWTTNLMAPEAYTLKGALDGWINREPNQSIHERAAVAYDKYQKCGLHAARRLFATGW